MEILVNGTPKQFSDNLNLEEMVCNICKDPTHVIAELNGAIIIREQRPSISLKNGDRLELITFVGGG